MSAEPEAEADSVRLSMLQAIQTLQQDQLRVLEVLGKLIHGMETLDQRVRKLEDDHARANGLEQTIRQ
jgi:hypothetical protein